MRSWLLIVSSFLAGAALAAETQSLDVTTLTESGTSRRAAGDLQLAAEELRMAHSLAAAPQLKARAAGALGLTLFEMHRYDEAEPLLEEAYRILESPTERARIANDLGNLQLGRQAPGEARRYYTEAQRLAPGDQSLQVSAGLNLARIAPPDQRRDHLSHIFSKLTSVHAERDRARYAANLGAQAIELGAPGRRIAYESLELARRIGAGLGEPRIQAQALDGLGRLYEGEQRVAEALRLTDEAVLLAQAADAREILYQLEWRRGRLLRASGESERALAAYRRAVDHIEAIRQDIPIEYQKGRSSFRDTFQPLYLELAELLLVQEAAASGEQAQRFSREARDVVELIKRSELEDFLGERCTVQSTGFQQAAPAIPENTAVLYPVLFPERLELLVETAQGLQRHSQALPEGELEKTVRRFAELLRDYRSTGYEHFAKPLYDRLLRPIDDLIAEQKIDTLVVVPDGALRLIPFSALRDGERFAIEKYAVVTVPALSLTSTASGRAGSGKMLLAGLSEPGPVVDKLPTWVLDELATAKESARSKRTVSEGARHSRALFTKREEGHPTTARALSKEEIAEILRLPEAKDEIESLRDKGDVLFNETFTLDRFEERITAGEYPVVHIASHGFFSSKAAASFVLAFDDLLTLDRMQQLLRSKELRDRPIELLSLSACQTAEGDDRAPLGFAGAALKARARSALGTLWPVEDHAAMRLMSGFYRQLGEQPMSKAKALQQAQRALIKEPSLRHPFFWAPFILVGSWL